MCSTRILIYLSLVWETTLQNQGGNNELEHLSKNPSKITCDENRKTEMVEHFFNVMFSAFQKTQPVCVCVQMCIGQPTYCYPNGCVKKQKESYSTEGTHRISKPLRFLVNENLDLFSNFMEPSLLRYQESNAPKLYSAKIGINSEKYKRPQFLSDPFKSRFQYKKMPNMEVRYDIREQIKNKNSDVFKVDAPQLANIRWPTKKHDRVNGYVNLGEEPLKNVEQDNPSFFISRLDEWEPDIVHAAQFFKRDLDVDIDAFKIKALYLIGETENGSKTNFSIERLIHNLVRNEMERQDNEMERQDNEMERQDNETSAVYNFVEKDVPHDFNNTYPIRLITDALAKANKTMTHINLREIVQTNQKLNFSSPQNETKCKIFNDMIKSFSKRIDEKNNASIKIAQSMIRKIFKVHSTDTETTTAVTNPSLANVQSTQDISNDYPENSIVTISSDSEDATITTTLMQPLTDITDSNSDTSKRKKSRQRVSQKLFNGKNY